MADKKVGEAFLFPLHGLTLLIPADIDWAAVGYLNSQIRKFSLFGWTGISENSSSIVQHGLQTHL